MNKWNFEERLRVNWKMCVVVKIIIEIIYFIERYERILI